MSRRGRSRWLRGVVAAFLRALVRIVVPADQPQAPQPLLPAGRYGSGLYARAMTPDEARAPRRLAEPPQRRWLDRERPPFYTTPHNHGRHR